MFLAALVDACNTLLSSTRFDISCIDLLAGSEEGAMLPSCGAPPSLSGIEYSDLCGWAL